MRVPYPARSAALCGMLLCAGCAWKSPFSTQPTDPSAAMAAAAGNAQPSDSGFSHIWKQTTSAMTPKPTVVAAPDPTTLSMKSGKISPELHLAAAHQFESQGSLLKAEEHYRKAIEMAPKDPNPQISYARLLHREDKVKEAVDAYNRLLAQNPNHAVALNDLALCLARHGQIDEARQLLTRAVQVKPESKLYHNNLAAILIESNRLDEAYAQMATVHGEAGANYNLGMLLQQRGNTDLAATYLQRAAQLDPSFVLPSPVAPVDQPAGPTLASPNASDGTNSVTISPPKGVAGYGGTAQIARRETVATLGSPQPGKDLPKITISPTSDFRVGDATAPAAPWTLPRTDLPTPPADQPPAYDSGDQPTLLPPVQVQGG